MFTNRNLRLRLPGVAANNQPAETIHPRDKNVLQAKRATIEFSLHWKSSLCRHIDRRYIEKIDFWRDLLPGSLQQNIANLLPGETYRESFAAGVLVPQHSDRNIIRFPKKLFTGSSHGTTSTPAVGRFYPKSCAWKALHSFPEDVTPFRLVDKSGNTLTADTNHPLAHYPATVEATLIKNLKTVTQRGGSANDLAEQLTSDGPGMQVPRGNFYTDIFRQYPLPRMNEADDLAFYRTPRLVHHLDSTARSRVREIYARHVSPGKRILDLMSSWESHLPENLAGCEVSGIGLNSEEMEKNKQLSHFTVRDLNRLPVLPFASDYFDAAVCTVSLEYLTRPGELFAEIARVLRPAGIFVAVLSDRWFPGKEIIHWSELHPFERQALILTYFLNEKRFADLQTESLQGFPRPADDKYSDILRYSDPLYIISARKCSEG